MKLNTISFLLIAGLAGFLHGQSWQAGAITVNVTKSPMSIKVSTGTKTLLDVTSIEIGTSKYSSISSVNAQTDKLEITLSSNAILTVKPVFAGINFNGKFASANSVKITMKDMSDHFFGITEQNLFGNGADLRGHTINISKESIESGNDQPYSRIWSAFYMSSLGYGSFYNTFAEGTYVFGSGGVTSITHKTNSIDWYIYYGPKGDKIHQAYFKSIVEIEKLGSRSPTKKVPIWACGLSIWHNHYTGSDQVLSHVKGFTSNKIPITSQFVDRPYSDGGNGWGEMNFKSAFKNPATWIQQINSDTGYNVKFMSWVCPATWGTAGPPEGGVFASEFYYLDLSNPATVSWYKQKLNSLQHSVGVQGHKMDRCDEFLTPVVNGNWSDGTPKSEKVCKYMYLNAKVTDEALRTKWNDDQFNFPRASYHLTQPYLGAVWGGDSRSPWGGLAGAVANGIKTSFLGFPVWGSDIGGYSKSAKITKEQYLRWLTFGCFSGLMENMLDDREPWTYSDVVDGQSFVERYKSVAELRMNLIPYIYSLANTSADNGVIMRPLPYMYPEDTKTYNIGDEYMFGPSLLVAPIISDGNTRSVYLPAGTWYNFFDPAKKHASGTITTSSTPVYQIPVYVKANSIYLTGQIYPGNSKRWMSDFDSKRNIVINATPGDGGESTTFTYVDYLDRDAGKEISLDVIAGSPNNIMRVKSPAMKIPGSVNLRLNDAPSSVVLNSVKLGASQYQYSALTSILSVPFAAQQQVDLQINGTVNAKIPFVKSELLGVLQIRVVNHGLLFVIPPAKGIHNSSQIYASIYDMCGKRLWRSNIPANQICGSSCEIPLQNISKGIYVAAVEIDGVVAECNRITIH